MSDTLNEPFGHFIRRLDYIAAANGGPLDMHDDPDFWSEEERESRRNPYAIKRENAVFFVKTESPFSQWHPSRFVIEGLAFSCVEQYMMFKKAELFGDFATARAIMKATTPEDYKALGRQVQNFNEDVWNAVCREITFHANMAKFSQNPHLKDALLATDDKLLVEAAHYDEIWGVGLREEDPAILDVRNWQGTNWLGFILMDVRDTLRRAAA